MRSLLLVLFLPLAALAGADEDWNRILAFDAGPKKKPSSRDEALQLARTHFALQRAAIGNFLAAHPEDPRTFDARLKLSDILAAEGKMDGQQAKVDEAMRLLEQLEKTEGVPREKCADAGFRRAALIMQSQKGSTDRMREVVISASRNFCVKYPGDRRGPRLLVEAATVCDEAPNLKRQLLEQALSATTEEPLKARIRDDLNRLDRLNAPVDLKFTALGGRAVDLRALRGNVVVLIFWAAGSPHSLLWLRDFRTAYEDLPKDRLRVITVSLDEEQAAVEEKLRDLRAGWPTHFDGKGWESAVARPLGINALPTVWIIDKKGNLRALNARENFETWIRQLLRE